MINLIGSSQNVGSKYGRVNRIPIKRRFKETLFQIKKKGFAKEKLYETVTRQKEILFDFAPSWIKEAESVAQEANINLSDLLLIDVFSNYSSPKKTSGRCTSFMAVGKASLTGESLLHKNRDIPGGSIPCAYVKKINKTLKYINCTDVWGVGSSQFLNEKGLAGVNNTGGRTEDCLEIGLSENHLLRKIAETASSCKESLAILQDIRSKGLFMSPRRRGVIFLFVDKESGLIVEMTTNYLACKWIKDNTEMRTNHFMLPEMKKWTSGKSLPGSYIRYQRICKLIQSRKSGITSQIFRQFSRDSANYPDSICRDNLETGFTVSGFTAVIRKNSTNSLSLAWIADGNPDNTFYIPFHIAMERLPEIIVRTNLFDVSQSIYNKKGIGKCLQRERKEFDNKTNSGLEKTEEKVLKYLKELPQKNIEKAKKTLTDFDCKRALEAMSKLKIYSDEC